MLSCSVCKGDSSSHSLPTSAAGFECFSTTVAPGAGVGFRCVLFFEVEADVAGAAFALFEKSALADFGLGGTFLTVLLPLVDSRSGCCCLRDVVELDLL